MTARKRLQLHGNGHPGSVALSLDGDAITFVSRVELILDCNGESTVRLTIPAEVLDLDLDVAAFVTAYAEPDSTT